MRRRARLYPSIVALVVSVSVGAVQAAELVTVEQELRQGGDNYDDPCFWQDPDDPGAAVACVTSKDDDLVDCFSLPSGTFAGAATGFAGAANNCDVDARRAELVTTDNGGARVLVHALPDLGAPIRELASPEFEEVTGVCVGHENGRSLVFVTDEETGMVYALDSLTGQEVRSFSYDLTKAEGIACDDGRERVYVCDDQSDDHSCRAFTYAGAPVLPEFGVVETGSDSEGVTVYRCGREDGYIIVSDQSNDEFEVFDRQEPFRHLCTFELARDGDRTNATDGIDVVQIPAYPNGLFGACDGCGGSSDELDLVAWERIAAACGLRICPLGASGDGPFCGDDGINRVEEDCDGADDALCPGACAADCTCPAPGAAPVAAVVADATVRKPARRGARADGLLEAGARPPRTAFLRVRVRGVHSQTIRAARLHLTVAAARSSKSNHGGEIYATSCGWDEQTLTWDGRPALVGSAIDAQPGRWRRGNQVGFDLSGYIVGDGDYCLALTSPSRDRIRYAAREMSRGPVVEITVCSTDAPCSVREGLE
jgi:3-phytase